MKERERRQYLQDELNLKEQQLIEGTKKQTELEMKLSQINANESEARNDNERLQKVSIALMHRSLEGHGHFSRTNSCLKNN